MKAIVEALIGIGTFVITFAIIIAVMIYLWPLVLGAVVIWGLIFLVGLIKSL